MQPNLLKIFILTSFVGLICTYTIHDEKPRAIQIAHSENHRFNFELNDLKKILEADNITDRQVVIVSMAGAFRKGISFLLNFFLRYLHAKYQKHDAWDWIGDFNSTELSGFAWRGGRRPTTNGIVIWSDIFTYDYENDDKVAIILDTQGTFDSQSTLLESTTVFALSTLISSVQCYNVMQNIQEDDLQHLQLFVEYARLALEQSNEKPFQNLLFIVRDWPYPLEEDYGWNGELIDEVLAEHPSTQTADMRQLRQQIRSSFASISAFLMPYPGRIVATGQFTGNMGELEDDFNTYLNVLVPSLFAPYNLVVKKINGQKVLAKKMVQSIEQYTTLVDVGILPEPKSIFQATAEVTNIILCNNALDEYSNFMEQYFDKTTYYNQTEMTKIHLYAKGNAIEQSQSKRKLGSAELISTFQLKLNDRIDSKFDVYQPKYERKRLALIESARIYNDKLVTDIFIKFRGRIFRWCNGLSKNDRNMLSSIYFNKQKGVALFEFDFLKMGDNLGNDKFSDSFRKLIESNIDLVMATLIDINKNIKLSRKIPTAATTTGGVAFGAAVGMITGGPPGAAIGSLLGGIVGFKLGGDDFVNTCGRILNLRHLR